MASSRDLVMIVVSLETMSIASYLLVGYLQRDPRSNEGALKYFVLGALSSGILLYGISLVYGATGTTDLGRIAEALSWGGAGPLLLFGVILMIVALGFKVAAAPFHMWVPDAYQGAPSPITAFVSTASKAAAFAVFARVFAQAFQPVGDRWILLLALLSVASMTVGNVAAIVQENMKRMLAYSSIAHAGYALMAVLALGRGGETGAFGLTALAIYMLIYTFMNMGAFGFVVMLRRENLAGDRVADFAGMARRAPLAAAAMLVLMLSLAGIPPTAGFLGKWYLFGAAIRAGFTWLAVAAVINSAISLYYYIRVVVTMYLKEPETDERYEASPFLIGALAVSLFFTVAIGLYPEPFIQFARAAVMH
jgi:NADH-quinone oxidoreductase subunit N